MGSLKAANSMQIWIVRTKIDKGVENMAATDLKALYELVYDIDTNNTDPVVVLRYDTLLSRGVSIETFNRSMAKRGTPYKITKHDDPKKVWLHLSKDGEAIA